MDPLEKVVLGTSELEVTRLGLGCAALGGLYGDIPDEQAVQVVHRAFDLGLNPVSYTHLTLPTKA